MMELAQARFPGEHVATLAAKLRGSGKHDGNRLNDTHPRGGS